MLTVLALMLVSAHAAEESAGNVDALSLSQQEELLEQKIASHLEQVQYLPRQFWWSVLHIVIYVLFMFSRLSVPYKLWGRQKKVAVP